MARINQELIERLRQRLGVGRARMYALIQEVAAQNRGLPRHLAALLLAGENGISIQRYATPQDLADLRGSPGHVQTPVVTREPVAPLRANAGRTTRSRRPKTKENTVFVVHGRDAKLRDSMYGLLRSLGLRVNEWGHAIRAARGGNPYVNDAVTKVMEQAQAIVVLLSPDDEAKLKSQFVASHERSTEGKSRGQARPNVIFETGIAIGTHHKKTLIVRIGDVKPFTDIGGMHILQLTGNDASRHEFANRLETLGCKIDRAGDQWLRVGDFAPTGPRNRGKSSKKHKV